MLNIHQKNSIMEITTPTEKGSRHIGGIIIVIIIDCCWNKVKNEEVQGR
jgi:hypothetical protein